MIKRYLFCFGFWTDSTMLWKERYLARSLKMTFKSIRSWHYSVHYVLKLNVGKHDHGTLNSRDENAWVIAVSSFFFRTFSGEYNSMDMITKHFMISDGFSRKETVTYDNINILYQEPPDQTYACLYSFWCIFHSDSK